MSFFIKKKHSNSSVKNKGRKRKAEKPTTKLDNDEITSDEDEEINALKSGTEEFGKSSEDENETAQEKKLRLAKMYLKEIEKEEQRRLENKQGTEDVISDRLKLDYLKQVGKLKLSVADQYVGAKVDDIKILKCKEHRKAITCVCLTSDNKFIFSGSKDASVVKWSIVENKKIGSIPYVKKCMASTKVLGHSKAITSIAISSDDKYMVVGDASTDIQVWNPVDLKHIGTLQGHRSAVTGVTFRLNSHTLYSCSKDKSVKVWSLDEMSYVETLYGHQDGITSIDSLSRERALTSGGLDKTIRIWKIAEESQLIYSGHSGSIDIVRLINEENFVSGGDNGQLCVWSTLKKKPLCTIKEAHGHDIKNLQPLWIISVSSLINTDLIASGSHNGLIKIWKLSDNFRTITELFTIEIEGFINDMAFTNDGQYLIAGIGNEHRFGRWFTIKSVKNSLAIIPLLKNV